MNCVFPSASVAVIAALAFGSTAAHADEPASPSIGAPYSETLEPDAPPPARSYWSTSFVGGVLTPLRSMEDSHQRGLAGGLTVSWTSRIGLGLALHSEYSPLPRRDVPELEAFETHFATFQLMPRFTLGRGMLRAWIGGGGGLALERTKRFVRDQLEDSSTDLAPMASGGIGIELHPLATGGIVLRALYNRTFGDLEYEYVTATGGLVFSF